MAERFTLDASVFLNGFNPAETGYEQSHRLLEELRQRRAPVIVPELLFPEVAATISRIRGDETAAREFAGALRLWPNLIIIPLDEALSKRAVEIAAQHRLRGSDSIYVAVADRFATTLVTLDREQAERGKAATITMSPADALAR